jgi:regulator of sigma E protease
VDHPVFEGMFFTLLAFAVTLGILIPFHELGHYVAARLCGVRILRFSLGFGKILLRRVDRHGTEWVISAIPLGGYVKMQDDAADLAFSSRPAPALPSQAPVGADFNTQPLRNRIFIVSAGPIFNLLLAILLYTGLNLVGVQELLALVEQPAPHTAAAQAGFQDGDRIVAVDGEPALSWEDVRWLLRESMTTGGRVDIDVQTTQGRKQERLLVLPASHWTPESEDPLLLAGLRPQESKSYVRKVVPGSVAEQAGLLPGDVILAVGAHTAPTTSVVIHTIQHHADRPLSLQVERKGAHVALTVVPDQFLKDGSTIGRIGIVLDSGLSTVTVRYGLVESFWRGVVRTVDTAWLSLRMMGHMVAGTISWRNLSGPVTIADYAGQSARVGLVAYVAFLALVSINLGVVNLLPIPMLDGGHLLYYFIEFVRGSPPPPAWREIGQRVGLGLLVSLMALALFNDFVRLFT